MRSELGLLTRSSRGRAKGLLSHMEGHFENVEDKTLLCKTLINCASNTTDGKNRSHMPLASLAEWMGTICFYLFILLRTSIRESNYAEFPSEAAKMTGWFAPNTSCLRLGFLEAETEAGIEVHVIYRGRALMRGSGGCRVGQGKELGMDPTGFGVQLKPNSTEDA